MTIFKGKDGMVGAGVVKNLCESLRQEVWFCTSLDFMQIGQLSL